MDETQWDIQEVKHLKKEQVIQNNLVMLLLFVLLVFLLITECTPSSLEYFFCLYG